jgi:hypothetical protein
VELIASQALLQAFHALLVLLVLLLRASPHHDEDREIEERAPTVLQETPSKIAMIKRVTARTPKTMAMLPLIGAFPVATMSPIDLPVRSVEHNTPRRFSRSTTKVMLRARAGLGLLSTAGCADFSVGGTPRRATAAQLDSS